MYIAIVILSVFMAACAQMLLKRAAQNKYPSIIRQYLNIWVITGYAIMFISMGTNIYAMRQGVQMKEVSIIESLSYLFVPALSFMLFKEKLSRRKILAIAIIMAGVIIFFQ